MFIKLKLKLKFCKKKAKQWMWRQIFKSLSLRCYHVFVHCSWKISITRSDSIVFLASSNIFSRDFDPRSKFKSLFRTWSTFDINFTNSVFASPSTGGAAIWTPIASVVISVIEFCLAPGFACIRIAISPFLFTLIAFNVVVFLISSFGCCCCLFDFLPPPFFDDILRFNIDNDWHKRQMDCIQKVLGFFRIWMEQQWKHWWYLGLTFKCHMWTMLYVCIRNTHCAAFTPTAWRVNSQLIGWI